MDLISPVTLRFQSPLLETSFSSILNSQLHAYDVACSLALPFIPLAVLSRRCSALLPTCFCRILGLCRHPTSCPVTVTLSDRPALSIALLAHGLVYGTLVTTLLFAPRPWLLRRRVNIACALRTWYTFILPIMVFFQPSKDGGEYTCTYVQGVHLHTVLLTTAIVPLCHQVPFSKHISLTILALLAVGMATLPQNGIAHGLLHVVRHAATVRLEGEADCGLLLKAEMAVGRWVGVTLAHASPGMTGALGSKAPPGDAWLVTVALLVLHVLAAVPVTVLLYHRELMLRLDYLRQRGVQAPPWLVSQWTARCLLLLGGTAVQVVLLTTLL